MVYFSKEHLFYYILLVAMKQICRLLFLFCWILSACRVNKPSLNHNFFIENKDFIQDCDMFPQLNSDFWPNFCIYSDRDLQKIAVKDQITPDLSSYQPLDTNSEVFQDKNYYFLFNRKFTGKQSAISKNQFSDVKSIWILGDDDFSQFVGYENGFLILPPYKLKIDSQTFSPFWQNSSHEAQNWCLRWRQTAQNNGKQYDKLVGVDKDWIYHIAWPFLSQDKEFWKVMKTEKKSDFQILKNNQIKSIITDDPNWELSHEQDFWEKQELDYLIDGRGCGLRIGQLNGKVYLGYKGQYRSFQADEKTLTRKNMEDEHYLLSDENYIYQISYDIDWDFYILHRRVK